METEHGDFNIEVSVFFVYEIWTAKTAEFAEIAGIRAVILQRMLCFFAGSRYIMIEKGSDCSL